MGMCTSIRLGNLDCFKSSLSEDFKQEEASEAAQVGESSSAATGQCSCVFNQNIAMHE